MAVTGNYFTSASPQVVAGLVLQSETRVRMGKSELYGSLETTSWLYTTYNTPIGLVAGQSLDLGELADLSFEHVPTFSRPDVANVLESSLQLLESEETTISLGLHQFSPTVLEAAIGTGTMYKIGNEHLIMVGGKCTVAKRPLEISAENIGCNAPSAPGDTDTAISLIVITAYSAQSTSGLPWSSLVANELNVLDLEFTVYPVPSHATGNKLFNINII